MISQVSGTLVTKALDRIEVTTPGGVTYELAVPLSAYEALPNVGSQVTLQTHVVVRDDDWQLFGFPTAFERRLFRRLLGATGVGPALALGMLSTLSAERVLQAIQARDVVTLQSVPRVGKKKAQQLILDLADKLGDVQEPGEPPSGVGRDGVSQDAVRALAALGYSQSDAERAVRVAIDAHPPVQHKAADLIRAALAELSKR
ncbi:MAG TPA: Holliday junction branch migration protein RuvA [Gemmatimonadaceae bacterium]|jgi:Holliday junction DNA helicase RuvA|nr:Holliday junction branch migration protein RuvA [Gemmatimonadaceae bacterium]